MSLISGNVTFYGNSTNDSTNPAAIVGVPLFLDNSSNQGVIYSGTFSGTAYNAGEVQNVATFVGSAVNSGVVAIATFNDGAVNLGTVTSSGLFYGTAVNSGVISGNAIFADTAANNGTVEGDADFAAGASNQGGTVNGTTGVYTPPSGHGDGAYSDGYYANGVIDTSYNSATPIQATDDSKYYTYNNGTSTLFNGAIELGGPWYSVTAGVIETTATFTGAFNNSGTYLNINNGVNVASLAEGIRILASNGLYYSFLGDGSLPANAFNGAIEIDGSWYSIVDGVKEATATFNGAGIGQPYNAYYPIVNGTLNNTSNANGVLINAHNGLYYNFNGSSGGLPTSSFNGAIKISDSWYSIVDGVKEATATFNGFYESITGGVFMTIENGTQTSTSAIGVFKSVNDGLYYYISSLNNLVGLANTAFTSGYYVSGVFDSSFSSSGAQAIDNDKWYVYVNGVTIGYATGYTIQSGVTNTITINGSSYNNGTYDLIVDANGDEVTANNQYASYGTEFYNDGSVYKYTSDGAGGYTQSYISSGTVLLAGETNTIDILGISYNNGTYDVVANGSGGTTNANYSYLTINTEFFNNGVDSYVSDGAGGYTVYYVNGYLIQNDVSNTININNTSYSNGTFDEVANGVGGSTIVYTYAPLGTEFYSANGISYQSDGNGGYTEVPV